MFNLLYIQHFVLQCYMPVYGTCCLIYVLVYFIYKVALYVTM